jgi:hypothetical protein
VVLDISLGASFFICAEEKSASCSLNKLIELSLKSQVNIFGTAETERNREFGPDDKARSLLISLSAQFKVLAKEVPDLLAGYPIPVDIRGDISLDDRSSK